MPRALHFAARRRPWALWLAVLLVLFGALAPTVSHALVLVRGEVSSLVEICTVTGPRWAVPVPNTVVDSPDGQESIPTLVHCPFCLLATDRVVPAPDVLVHLFAVLGEHQAPTIGQAFFFSPPFALTPPPRGPPDLAYAI